MLQRHHEENEKTNHTHAGRNTKRGFVSGTYQNKLNYIYLKWVNFMICELHLCKASEIVPSANSLFGSSDSLPSSFFDLLQGRPTRTPPQADVGHRKQNGVANVTNFLCPRASYNLAESHFLSYKTVIRSVLFM